MLSYEFFLLGSMIYMAHDTTRQGRSFMAILLFVFGVLMYVGQVFFEKAA